MCFSLDFIMQVCIWIVVLMGFWAVIKLALPYLTGVLPDIVVQIIRIVIWVIIAIIAIYIIFGLLSCLLGAAGGLGHHPFH